MKPEVKTPLPGPKAQELLARGEKVLSPSYVRPYPFVPARGQGVFLEDVDGNVFLDFMAGIAVNTTGYAHPRVLAAVKAQAERFAHVCFSDFTHEPTLSLAERLVAKVGGGYRVFFGNSGTEGIEAAIKLVRHHTGRPYLLAFTGAFHGRSLGALSLTASKSAYRKGFAPLLPGVVHVPFPNPFRPPLGASPEEVGEAVLAHLEHLFATVLPPEEVAAFFLEPIQGEGGYVLPPAGFLPKLKALLERHGILLVADEVQTGAGRTGRFLALEHEGVEADVYVLAKGLASGYPLSARPLSRGARELAPRGPRHHLRRPGGGGGRSPGHPGPPRGGPHGKRQGSGGLPPRRPKGDAEALSLPGGRAGPGPHDRPGFRKPRGAPPGPPGPGAKAGL
jgi:4-aminobutyrate aminotransferase